MRRPGQVVTRSFAAGSRPGPLRPAAAPPVPTGRPTPEFQRHHDVDAPRIDGGAFGPGWRVESRLYALFDAGRIDRQQLDAATLWGRWAERTAPACTQRWTPRLDPPLYPTASDMPLRVDAAAALRRVAETLGPLRVRILEAVIVRDLSWRELGRLLRCHYETAQGRAIEAIVALGLCFDDERVPPPPLRYRIEPGRQ